MTPPPLRIIFMGTPDFAVPSLDILVQNHYTIVAVVTAPDKPAGRGLKVQESPVKKYAKEKGIKILQPVNLKDETFIRELKALNANLQIVVAFRMLPEAVWKIPSLGTFNLHASLLPQYRGAAPIHHAVMNGEKKTGVTTFFLQHAIDTGNIILQEKTSIGDDETTGELHDRLMVLGAGLVLKTVKQIESGNYKTTDQQSFLKPGDEIKTAPKLFKENCRIDWSKPADEIHNFIRGLSPYPGAWTEMVSPDGEKHNLKIFMAKKENTDLKLKAGAIQVEKKKNLIVGAGSGNLSVLELQVAGKKKMKTEELMRGFTIDNSWKMS